MAMHHTPHSKDLVLVGGGHAHVHVLKSFGMRPVEGVRLTLITRDVETPYSGMIPGFVAGHYRHDDCHIDLYRLARFAGARLIHDEAIGLDRDTRQVVCRAHPPIRYDVLSLDIGSMPATDHVPGASRHTTPLKPIDGLAERWDRLARRVRSAVRPLDIVVVGGGAAGVEVALAMQHRLRAQPASGARPAYAPRFTLVTSGPLLPNHNARVRAAFRRTLAARQVTCHENASVRRVDDHTLALEDGRRIPFDEALWATDAGPAAWLAETGLALDERGFVAVGASLRSVDDDAVFAAGDVAAVLPHPREKAGVFAVRQGPPLAENLRRALTGRPLKPFSPQKRALGLISTGDRYAVASRGPFVTEGRWIWRLKDRIDRRWMRQYQALPAMEGETGRRAGVGTRTHPAAATGAAMRCGGCGGKLPSDVLTRVMRRLQPGPDDAVPVGLDSPDDAAVVRPPRTGLMLQTVDFFRAFVSDPYLFGRIAANHALGDIHAMGGAPLTALAIVSLPPDGDDLVEHDLFQLLRGGMDTLQASGARLVGGHSAEGAELALGFSITGTVPEDRILRKSGLRPGDRLILTKPLGIGTLLAAEMQGKARARWIVAAIRSALRSSGPAAGCLAAEGATACTDVTGFGLLGHLIEMLEASGASAMLDLGAIPVLDGARETIDAGIVSSLHPSNAKFERLLDDGGAAGHRPPLLPLLFDPQTAGGLLAGVPAARAAACLAALRRLGDRNAAIIGIVEPATDTERRVRLVRLADVAAESKAHPSGMEPATASSG